MLKKFLMSLIVVVNVSAAEPEDQYYKNLSQQQQAIKKLQEIKNLKEEVKKSIENSVNEDRARVVLRDSQFDNVLEEYVKNVFLSDYSDNVTVCNKTFNADELSKIREELRLRFDYPVVIGKTFEEYYDQMKYPRLLHEVGIHTKPAHRSHHNSLDKYQS